MVKLKKLFWVVGVLIVVIIGSLIAIATLVDPNEYKPLITERVEKQTGRELTIDGDLKLTYYPWVGLEAGNLAFQNSTGFGDLPMASVDQVNIQVKLLPLLKKQLEVGEILLHKPHFQLQVLEDGRTNWQDLVGDSTTASNEGDVGVGIAGLAIQGVSIENGSLDWNNAATNQQFQISDFNLDTGKLQADMPLDMALSLVLEGNVLPEALQVELATTIKADQQFQNIDLENTELNAEMGSQSYQVEFVDLMLDLAGQRLTLPKLDLTLPESRISASVKATNLMSSPTFDGELDITISDIQKMFDQFGVDTGLESGFIEDVQIKTAYRYLENAVELNSLDSTLTLNGAEVSTVLPFMKLNLDSETLNIPEMVINLAESTILLNAEGDSLMSEAEDLVVHGNMSIESQDLSSFLSVLDLADIIPAGLFQAFTTQYKYQIADGGLTLKDMDSNLDQTELEGDLEYANLIVEGAQTLNLNQDIQNVDIGHVLQVLDITEKFTGAGSVNLGLHSIDLDKENVVENMGGTMAFNLEDGAIKGFDLQAALIAIAQAASAGTSNYEPDKETRFAELSGSFVGSEGRFNTDDIQMKAPAIRVKGAGWLDLKLEKLDFDLDVVVVDSIEGQGGVALENLKGVSIPLAISGSFEQPAFQLNLSKLLEQQAKDAVQKSIEKKVGNTLKSLLGG